MIKLRSPLVLKAAPSNRWEMFFDTGELFSLETPFRDYLEQIRQQLLTDAPAELHLPPALGEDDCVDGQLHWREHVVAIYFERALSYLTLTGADEAAMRRALDLIKPLAVIA